MLVALANNPMRAMRQFVLLIWVCVCATPSVIHAQDAQFPALSGRVNDFANIIDAETRNSLIAQLIQHEEATSNQVVVATVASLNGYDIADYGLQLARKWGLGTKENNNGILLLVAPNERKVRIEVGYGLEGALPDATAGHIIRHRILPQFRERDYSLGVKRGVDSILQAIDGEYDSAEVVKENPEKVPKIAIPAIFLFLMGGQFAAARTGYRREAQALVPAGMVGVIVLLVSSNLFFAVAGAVAVFAFMFFAAKRNPGSALHNRNLDQHRQSGSGFGGSGGW